MLASFQDLGPLSDRMEKLKRSARGSERGTESSFKRRLLTESGLAALPTERFES